VGSNVYTHLFYMARESYVRYDQSSTLIQYVLLYIYRTYINVTYYFYSNVHPLLCKCRTRTLRTRTKPHVNVRSATPFLVDVYPNPYKNNTNNKG
jgi:hypothetical protein